MKQLIVIASLLIISGIACSKKADLTNDANDTSNCEAVTVTQIGTLCSQWGIKTQNNIVYPSSNIPEEFKAEGRFVCAAFELYDDLRNCACCGGVWANIKSMKYFVR
jgi:hypothetical protein